MSAKVIVLMRLPNSCPPDCGCHKLSHPEKMASLVKNLSEYLKERESTELSKGLSVKGSAVYLNPQNH
jgi:hypothetical protein